MTQRKRLQLVAALIIAPLVIAIPALLPRLGEPGFFLRNIDVVLIFVVVPFGAALSLYLGAARSRR